MKWIARLESEFLEVTGTSRISCLNLNYPSEQRAQDRFAIWAHLTFIKWKVWTFTVSSNQVSRQCQQALAKRAYLLWHTLNIHQRILTQNRRAETNMAHMHTHQSPRHSSSSSSYASGLKMNQICCLKTLRNTNIHQSAGFYGHMWHWRPRKTRCSLVIRRVSNGKV